jgi:hypothetical protein
MRLMLACALLLSIFVGCQQPTNLQPLISVAGTYALIEHRRTPPAPVAPSQGDCSKGCKCGGTGVEKTGDGLSVTECRCPDGCACKKKAAAKTFSTDAVCTTGTCAGWPPRNIAH